MATIITSAGIIRESDKPRTGVTSEIPDWFFDELFSNGINLTELDAWEEFQAQLRGEGIEEGSDEWEERIDDYSSQCIDPDSSYWILGAWIKNADGQYEIDRSGKSGDYAATYCNANGDIVCVEWSTATVQCHHTSPCYVMADGSGPCGDLDTAGDSVTAYTFPSD